MYHKMLEKSLLWTIRTSAITAQDHVSACMQNVLTMKLTKYIPTTVYTLQHANVCGDILYTYWLFLPPNVSMLCNYVAMFKAAHWNINQSIYHAQFHGLLSYYYYIYAEGHQCMEISMVIKKADNKFAHKQYHTKLNPDCMVHTYVRI